MRSRAAIFLILAVVLALSPNANAHLAGEPTRVPSSLSAAGEGEILTGIWPRTMAVDTSNNLWVANGFDNTVMRVDEGTGIIIDVPAIPAGSQPTAMAWLDATKTMWVASYDDASLIPIEFDQGKPVKREPIFLGDSRPVGMAVSGGNIWVITQVKDSLITRENLIRFNPATKTILSRLTVGTFPTAIISSATVANPDDRTLYVANGHDDSISVIDTRQDNGNGKVVATVTKGVPPYPMSLSFDGIYLWIGSYECVKYDKDNCSESKVARINTFTGEPAPVPDNLPGRQVFVSFNSGHVFVADGHGDGIADLNVVTAISTRKIMNPPKNAGRGSYYGAAMMTKRYLYVADWTNDRLLRFVAPTPIAIPPTPTFSPPTITPSPAPPTPTPQPCNPDPKFPPRLTAGMKARVIDDAFKVQLFIRTQPNLEDSSRVNPLKLFDVGEEFMVLDGPFANNKPITKTNSASCFYKVEGVKRKEYAGLVTEGGLERDGKDKRYYIEPVK